MKRKKSTQQIINSQKSAFKRGILKRIINEKLDRKKLINYFLQRRIKHETQIDAMINDYSIIYHFQAINYLLLQANNNALSKGKSISDHIDYLTKISNNWAKLRHNEVKMHRNIVKNIHPSFPATEEIHKKIKNMGFEGTDVYKLYYNPPSDFDEPLRSDIITLKKEIIGSYYFTGIPELARMIEYLNKNKSDTIEKLSNYFNIYETTQKLLLTDSKTYDKMKTELGFDFIHQKGQSSPTPIGFYLTNGEIIIDLEIIRLLKRFADYNTKESKKIRANFFERIIRSVGLANGWKVEDFKVEFLRLPEDRKENLNPNVTEVDIILQKQNKHLLIESKHWGIWSFHFLGKEDQSRQEMLRSSAEKMAFRRRLYAEKNNINEKNIDLLIVSSIKEEWQTIENIPIISIDNLPEFLQNYRC